MGSDALPFMPVWLDDLFRSSNWTSRDAEEMGVYMHLLLTSWSWDGLPDEEARIRRLVEPLLVRRSWPEIWPWLDGLFPVAADGRRRNRKQEEVRSRSSAVAEKRSEAGRKGAKAMHARRSGGKADGKADDTDDGNRMANAWQTHAVAMPSYNPTTQENPTDRQTLQPPHTASPSARVRARGGSVADDGPLNGIQSDEPSRGHRIAQGETAPPEAWDAGSEAKNAAWRDWLAHMAQQAVPATDKTLSKHWHRLAGWTDGQAVAVIEDAINLGARGWTDRIVARALARVAEESGGLGLVGLRLAADWTMPPELGEEFRPNWRRWLEHHADRGATDAQLRGHLESLAGIGRDAAERALRYAIDQGMTGLTQRVLERARVVEEQPVPAVGSGLTHAELRRLGWDDAANGRI